MTAVDFSSDCTNSTTDINVLHTSKDHEQNVRIVFDLGLHYIRIHLLH